MGGDDIVEWSARLTTERESTTITVSAETTATATTAKYPIKSMLLEAYPLPFNIRADGNDK
jgi:hypothetical protein